MQDSVWLGVEARQVTMQLAQCRDGGTPIIPIITEISVAPNSACAPIRNIDVFNLQDALIDRLRAAIFPGRIALDQWIGFDPARDREGAQIRLYTRSLLTAAELPLIDHTVLELKHDSGKCLRIGHGLGAVIDFRLNPPGHPTGRDDQIPRDGWRQLVPLVRMLRRRDPGTPGDDAVLVRPRWLVRDRTSRFRGANLAALNPVQVNSYLRKIDCGPATRRRDAVLGLALVSARPERGTARASTRQVFSGAVSWPSSSASINGRTARR